MTPAERAAEALAAIPGWQGARLARLDGGVINETWLVDDGGRRAVLRLDAEPRHFPLNSRRDEATVQRSAAEAGLATEVLHAADGVYLAVFAAGAPWNAKWLADPDRLMALGRRLRELHSLPLTGRTFDALAAAELYVRRLQGRDVDRAEVERRLATIRAYRAPANLCCCHNDLVAENIVSTPDILFIDWDYACDNDPFFDLATVIEHHHLSQRSAIVLLDAYFGGGGDAWLKQLGRMRELYAALAWLWEASRD